MPTCSFLLNEVNVKIKLVRSRNSFCLMAGDEFKVKIVSAIMFVRKVKLSPSVFLAHARALEADRRTVSRDSRLENRLES